MSVSHQATREARFSELRSIVNSLDVSFRQLDEAADSTAGHTSWDTVIAQIDADLVRLAANRDYLDGLRTAMNTKLSP